MDALFGFESILVAFGWLLVTLLRVLVPLVMLGAAIWAARRLPAGIGGALIVGTSVTLLCALASALVFSPLAMTRLNIGSAMFSYFSMGLSVVSTLGGLCFASGFVALVLWLPERNS